MGAIMARSLEGASLPAGAAGITASGAMALSAAARDQFAAALHRVFLAGTAVSAAGFVATWFLPPVHFTQGVRTSTGEQLIEAEMTNLRPDDEPVAVPE
jgi:hypothetical protein